MNVVFGLGVMEVAVLIALLALLMVPAVILLVVLRRRPQGPSVGDLNALLAENEDLRDEVARLKKQSKGANSP